MDFVEEQALDQYNYVLRETRTAEIIQDVKDFRSDIGILYMDNYNRKIISRALEDAGLTFTPLFSCRPHVFVGSHHPLAGRDVVTAEDLADYPRYSFEQGTNNSFYYSEEPLSYYPHKKRIIISDRGTLSNLLTHHNGYTVSTGVLSSEMHTGIESLPLDTDETMTLGYILHGDRATSPLVEHYIRCLEKQIAAYSVSNDITQQ